MDAFRASGLTQTAFARQNGLSPGFLSRRLKKSQPKLAHETPHPVRFLEVDLPPLPGTSLYRILLPRDLTLEVSSGFRLSEVTSLLRVLLEVHSSPRGGTQ